MPISIMTRGERRLIRLVRKTTTHGYTSSRRRTCHHSRKRSTIRKNTRRILARISTTRITMTGCGSSHVTTCHRWPRIPRGNLQGEITRMAQLLAKKKHSSIFLSTRRKTSRRTLAGMIITTTGSTIFRGTTCRHWRRIMPPKSQSEVVEEEQDINGIRRSQCKVINICNRKEEGITESDMFKLKMFQKLFK